MGTDWEFTIIGTVLLVGFFTMMSLGMYFDSHRPVTNGLEGTVIWVQPDSIEAETIGGEVCYGDTKGAEITIFVPNDDGKFKFGQSVRVIRYE
jgi:hypothetical protein